MANSLPYLMTPGSLTNLFGKIKAAAVPDRFSQEFLSDTLNLKGGGPKALIPFLKKMKFIDSTGVPTERYKEFRNDKKSGSAVAAAVRDLYQPLYAKNVNAHNLGKEELTGLIVECTGGSANDRVTQAIRLTFEALKKAADFTKTEPTISKDEPTKPKKTMEAGSEEASTELGVIRLGYTVNLYLPATKDVEVFNAIFRSLKANLLSRTK